MEVKTVKKQGGMCAFLLIAFLLMSACATRGTDLSQQSLVFDNNAIKDYRTELLENGQKIYISKSLKAKLTASDLAQILEGTHDEYKLVAHHNQQKSGYYLLADKNHNLIEGLIVLHKLNNNRKLVRSTLSGRHNAMLLNSEVFMTTQELKEGKHEVAH